MRTAGARAGVGRLGRRFGIGIALASALAGQAAGQLGPSGTPITYSAKAFSYLAAVGIALDGSIEIASIQPPMQGFSQTPALILQNLTTSGQIGAGQSQTVTTTVSQLNPEIAPLVPSGYVVGWANQEVIFQPMLDGGRLAVASASAGSPDTVSARLFDAAGQPTSAEIQLNLTGPASAVRVSGLTSGGFVASYQVGAVGLVARLFDGTGAPVSSELMLSPGIDLRNIGLAPLGDGGFAAAWVHHNGGYFVQRFDANGAPVGSAANPTGLDGGGSGLVAANAAGQIALAWMTTDPSARQPPATAFDLQLYDATLQPVGGTRTVASTAAAGAPYPLLNALAVNSKGETLVAWTRWQQATISNALVQVFDAEGNPEGDVVQVNPVTNAVAAAIGALAAPDGSWGVLWTDNLKATMQRLSSSTCSPAATSLCLGANRFRLDATFTDPRTGIVGTAQPVGLDAATGGFWFFDARNPELVVKVLDGTMVNGHLWVFFASLSTVEFDLTVTDTLTGQQRTYQNPPGVQASQADTSAFVSTQPDAARRPATHSSQLSFAVPHDDPGAPVCHSTAAALCLGPSRFSVTVSWQDPSTGLSGFGTTQQLSDESGAFWFFDPSNVELAVKILDGTAINGHFWVFYAALTDLAFDITVVDNASIEHVSRGYHKAAGILAARADTNAF